MNPATQDSTKPFRLVKYFSLTAMVVIFVSTLALGVFIAHRARSELLQKSEDYAMLVAANLNHQVIMQFVLPTVFKYGRVQLSNPLQYERLDKVARNTIHGFKIDRVDIYDLNEFITYSTDGSLVAPFRSGRKGFRHGSGRGFLMQIRKDSRDERSLIQIIGRAARNVNSKVVLYADVLTDSIQKALAETNRRRAVQLEYNTKHGITPTTIIKPIKEKIVEITDTKHIPKKDIPAILVNLDLEMRKAADDLDFEKAIALRDRINKLKKSMMI